MGFFRRKKQVESPLVSFDVEYAARPPRKRSWIEHFHLQSWWKRTFSSQEQAVIETRCPWWFANAPDPDDPFRGQFDNGYPPPTAAEQLLVLAANFSFSQDRIIWERIVAKAEQEAAPESYDLHRVYDTLIGFWYSQREVDAVALPRAIEYSRRQIAIAPRTIESLRKREIQLYQWRVREIPPRDRLPFVLELPEHRGFKQLAIIWEKDRRFEEALRLCEVASEQGWREDWAKRQQRLQGKIDKRGTMIDSEYEIIDRRAIPEPVKVSAQPQRPKFCAECGTHLHERAKFCTVCGTRIEP